LDQFFWKWRGLKSTQSPPGYATVTLYDMWLYVHLLFYSFLFPCKSSSDNIFFSPLILIEHVPYVLNVLFQSQPVLFFLMYMKKIYKNKYQNNIFIDKIVAKIRSRSLKSQRKGKAKNLSAFFSFSFLRSDH